MDTIITVRNFSKKFGNTTVISDLSFDVIRGEVFAFLGANGSGKTTTIRTLLGIYEADQGELLINGEKYSQEQSHILGYLPEERGLYTSSKVLETIIYFGQLKGLSYIEAKKRGVVFLERVGLADKQNINISKLSSGQQQKIQLGITIINRPQLLILDEPTKGLDPVNRALFMEMLLELNKEGSTIIFSTHQMDEAERIADRLVMIKKGKRALYGPINEVKESFGSNHIHMNFTGQIPEQTNLYSAHIENNYAELTPKTGATYDQILHFLLTKEVSISKFEVSTPSLNQIFISVSQENNG